MKSEDIEFLFNSKEIREKASYKVDETFDLFLAKSSQEKTAEFVNKIRDIFEGDKLKRRKRKNVRM